MASWEGLQSLVSKAYTCGYCGNNVASMLGYDTKKRSDSAAPRPRIYICHHCSNPTHFSNTYKGIQTPGPAFGGKVEHIGSVEVEALYNEARNCMKVNAYTAAVMCCRKLLMNIAVARGAKEGLRFAEYVSFLSDQGFVPPDGKGWVDQIRKKGNEATHEIALMEREDAEDLITFSEMLLRFIYEFSGRLKARAGKANGLPQNPPATPRGSRPTLG